MNEYALIEVVSGLFVFAIALMLPHLEKRAFWRGFREEAARLRRF